MAVVIFFFFSLEIRILSTDTIGIQRPRRIIHKIHTKPKGDWKCCKNKKCMITRDIVYGNTLCNAQYAFVRSMGIKRKFGD